MNDRPTNSSTTAIDGFPGRLAELIGSSSIRAFARKAGVSDTFLRQCLAGRTEPTRTKLLALAEAGGVSVEWLATGGAGGGADGRVPGPRVVEGPVLDRKLLAAVIGSVEEVLAETGHALTPERKALLVTALYELRADGREPGPVSRDEIVALVARGE